MTNRQIAIFSYGLACGLLMAAVELFVHAALDRRLLVTALAGGAALTGLIGLVHARGRVER